MNRRKLLYAVLVSIIVASGLFLLMRWPGINVVITNNSGQKVSDMVVEFSGGSHHIPELRTGDTTRIGVHPTGASHLTMSFFDSGGSNHSELIDVYFENGDHGRVEIRIDPTYKVNWVESKSEVIQKLSKHLSTNAKFFIDSKTSLRFIPEVSSGVSVWTFKFSQGVLVEVIATNS